MAEGFNKAMANRSLRTIKTELEFLLDADVISQQQFETISAQLPANAAAGRTAVTGAAVSPAPTPEPPVNQFQAMNVAREQPLSEKKGGYYAQDQHSNPPPPAYQTPPPAPVGPPALAYASALYQYNAQDAGDLALMPNDKITVTEYMNNEWWKGRNDRTGQEGIFPASYVRRDDAKAMAPPVQMAPQPSNYGNMPLDVSNGAQPAPQQNESGEPNKGAEMGKKFGKKLGNAAIFGAGATIGGNIVNSIF
ncbi:SH3-domain-containing protein [Aaosphaeria arxii CBS 175.79]|uniref:SH3-domain-containing protein n=1 Tax=Aaosphaeria arxii CBS 175.79 TaxID=1450172 RepID=A0A6A5Y8P4_9PLEO|nr:SH3-domain-containing protein [Aaosphaeria arxii CBS 175.79]KAF2020944.1 SH3-domain-containing protein [Aaosphaeria arxii CBS 175.79]